ncbi:GntR family transcriptional regulator [Mesoterricola silvestris]|uniref:GntR family transcriptional regulator n=1 Tax=Mesoterricola silvestris TaxID=2927979 RepID=A0AA48KA05_9BACT|nr:GntR family transcriptional regulator [Mesoterricola silvestris]BDU74091.1 GntR family transcriptional regulator [Mesoterricola silvestris]
MAIQVKSLREQVYDHLKAELKSGALDTGAFLDLKALAAELGVSRTPLRDALIQLEAEEFVTISPRRGVAVRTLDATDIKEIYQLVGALEASAVLASAPLRPGDIPRLRELNRLATLAVEAGDWHAYYEHNYAFHDLFLERQGNRRITALVHRKKQQLYDWNRKFERIHATWEHSGLLEHGEMVDLLEQGRIEDAATYLRDVHWGFKVQEPFVNEVYFQERA